MTNPSQERARRQFITAEMVQESVGKFGADLPWCRTVANRLNGLLAAEFEELEREALAEYKKSLDVPELEDFTKGAVIEAQHQRQRWGDEHDTDKEPEEWFWLVGYLAGKGLQAQRSGNMEKFKHHLVTGAAVLANWHARAKTALEAKQPGARKGEG